jgi:hypothetical protein
MALSTSTGEDVSSASTVFFFVLGMPTFLERPNSSCSARTGNQ